MTADLRPWAVTTAERVTRCWYQSTAVELARLTAGTVTQTGLALAEPVDHLGGDQ
jgi:hypothetical protein